MILEFLARQEDLGLLLDLHHQDDPVFHHILVNLAHPVDQLDQKDQPNLAHPVNIINLCISTY